MTTPEDNTLQECDTAPPDQNGLYPGDTGTLPLDARRTFVQLLLGPAIYGLHQKQHWQQLTRYEKELRSHLANLFLELVVDNDRQVAFIRQAETEGIESPTILRRAPMTFIDTVLLLHLRQQLSQAESQGERAVIDIHDIEQHLALYESQLNTDHAGYQKRIKNAIDKAKRNSMLQSLGSNGNRLEISPITRLLFPLEAITQLTEQYRDLIHAESEL